MSELSPVCTKQLIKNIIPAYCNHDNMGKDGKSGITYQEDIIVAI
jgi:hypothetical protein